MSNMTPKLWICSKERLINFFLLISIFLSCTDLELVYLKRCIVLLWLHSTHSERFTALLWLHPLHSLTVKRFTVMLWLHSTHSERCIVLLWLHPLHSLTVKRFSVMLQYDCTLHTHSERFYSVVVITLSSLRMGNIVVLITPCSLTQKRCVITLPSLRKGLQFCCD